MPPPEYMRNPLLDADRNLGFLRGGRNSLRIDRGSPRVANGGLPPPDRRQQIAAPRVSVGSGTLGSAIARMLTNADAARYQRQVSSLPVA